MKETIAIIILLVAAFLSSMADVDEPVVVEPVVLDLPISTPWATELPPTPLPTETPPFTAVISCSPVPVDGPVPMPPILVPVDPVYHERQPTR